MLPETKPRTNQDIMTVNGREPGSLHLSVGLRTGGTTKGETQVYEGVKKKSREAENYGP